MAFITWKIACRHQVPFMYTLSDCGFVLDIEDQDHNYLSAHWKQFAHGPWLHMDLTWMIAKKLALGSFHLTTSFWALRNWWRPFMQFTTFLWVRSTPFGSPMVPLVYIIMEMSCLDGGVRSTEFSFPWIMHWPHNQVLLITATLHYTFPHLKKNLQIF
jgi:hypothetical protein